MTLNGNDIVRGGDNVSIGRSVHFVDANGAHRAAIVTEVFGGGRVHLATFVPTFGVIDRSYVSYSEDNERMTWHWPERV